MGRRASTFVKVIAVIILYLILVTSTTLRYSTYFTALVSIGLFVVVFYVLTRLGGLAKPEEETYEEEYEEEMAPRRTKPEMRRANAREPVLPPEIVCPRCGHLNPPDAEFCIECGGQLE